MWRVPGISVWVGLAVLAFWFALSGPSRWPLFAVIAAITLVRFGYAPKPNVDR